VTRRWEDPAPPRALAETRAATAVLAAFLVVAIALMAGALS
jgi:hypothetical protein